MQIQAPRVSPFDEQFARMDEYPIEIPEPVSDFSEEIDDGEIIYESQKDGRKTYSTTEMDYFPRKREFLSMGVGFFYIFGFSA